MLYFTAASMTAYIHFLSLSSPLTAGKEASAHLPRQQRGEIHIRAVCDGTESLKSRKARFTGVGVFCVVLSEAESGIVTLSNSVRKERVNGNQIFFIIPAS